MKRICLEFLVPLLLINVGGCFQPYIYQPVTFHVKDAETNEPVSNVEIETYYRTMLDFGRLLPSFGPTRGITDANGEVTLMIDVGKKQLLIEVDKKEYIKKGLDRYDILEISKSNGLLGWRKSCDLIVYKNNTEVSFLLPEGYRGPVLVDYENPKAQPKLIAPGQFVYEINSCGHVSIREERDIISAKIRVQYRNGDEIRFVEDRHPADLDTQEVAMRFVSRADSHPPGMVFLVGTLDEANHLSNLLWKNGNFNEAEFRRLVGIVAK